MSRFKPKRAAQLGARHGRRPKKPPVSAESIRLTPLRDDRGNVIGYADPDFGRLYKPNHQPSSPVVGTRLSRSHTRRRVAATELGIPVAASVATWERKLLDRLG